MASLLREIHNVQNPALGAALLWRFCIGYTHGNATKDAPPLPVLFIVLPILLHPELASVITGMRTATGLRAFADRFKESRSSKSDLIFGIHRRTHQMRGLTLESLRLAITSKLLSLLVPPDGTVVPLSETMPRGASIPSSTQTLLRNAEKLGVWCGRLTLHEISVIFKVAF